MKKRISPSMANAIKCAKAIASLQKHNYVNIELLRHRMEEVGLPIGKPKLYKIWKYLIDNHTITKVNRREYHWNGSLQIWNDPDKANQYCLTMLRSTKTSKHENVSVVTVDPIKSFSDDALAQELRDRGWTVECYKQVTVNI